MNHSRPGFPIRWFFFYAIVAVFSSTATNSLAVAEKPDAKAARTHKTIATLFSFDDAKVPDEIEFQNATGSIVPGWTEGTRALRVQMTSKENGYTGLAIKPKSTWDWSRHQDFSLAFDIANQGEVSTQLYLNISDGDGNTYTRCVCVPVGDAKTYYAKLHGHDFALPEEREANDLNFSSGLRGNPPTWTGYNDVMFISMWGKKNLNLSAIKLISLSVQSALRDKEITIDNIRLIYNPPMDEGFLTGIVDRYGQNAKVEFVGKIHSDEELIEQRDAELNALDKGGLMSDRSKFSGWSEGPKLEATGYFRTEKIDGKWSLVTPDGYPYFATGIDIIRLANLTTMTGYDFDESLVPQRSKDDLTPEDSVGLNRIDAKAVPSRHVVSEVRANMFSWLPSYDEPGGKHFGYRRDAHSGPMKRGEVYSFYSANLDRKYSDMGDFMEVWRDITVKRMLDWGFTSFGNWTDPSFYDNNRIPFFANGWIIGNFKTVSSGNDFWAPMPDVFDPVFEQRAMVTAEQVADEVRDSPWCVGVFIDNEKSFGRPETDQSRLGIVIHTLGRNGSEVPTKAEFTRLMKQKHGTIDKLNAAWKKQIGDWDEFDKGIDSKIETDAQAADYSDLLHAYASKYFEVVAGAVKKHMPNHLYLGSRFPDWGMPLEVVTACAKHADVISFNSYKEGLPDHKWGFLSEIDMPCIIGEFHFGSSDSGLYHPGLLHTANQADRGRMFQEYMHSVIDNRYFVGAHWFQYIDSPITGRAYDGENYNVGFVSVADVPFQPLVDAAKELHRDLYQRRFSTGESD